MASSARPSAVASTSPGRTSTSSRGSSGSSGCTVFPPDDFWHADVSGLPLSPHTAAWVAAVGTAKPLKADFGSGLWDGGPIGIPVTDVPPGTAKVKMVFTWADESNPGPYPIPRTAAVEGGSASTGDRHVLAFDSVACLSYELYNAHLQSDGSWQADAGAVFDLRSDKMRPSGWTSADAAGLSILAPLVTYDEVASGVIDHALRVTVPRADDTFVWPASHHVGSVADGSLPPMGAWFRLKASVDISGFPKADRVILQALKTHGAIVADIGSSWYVSGTPDSRWNNDTLAALGQVPGSDFEAVDPSSIMVARTSGQVRG